MARLSGGPSLGLTLRHAWPRPSRKKATGLYVKNYEESSGGRARQGGVTLELLGRGGRRLQRGEEEDMVVERRRVERGEERVAKADVIGVGRGEDHQPGVQVRRAVRVGVACDKRAERERDEADEALRADDGGEEAPVERRPVERRDLPEEQRGQPDVAQVGRQAHLALLIDHAAALARIAQHLHADHDGDDLDEDLDGCCARSVFHGDRWEASRS